MPDSMPATRPQPSDDLTCPATAHDGRMTCVKPLYRARNGEAWAHGGGHFFATAEGRELLASGDYDAEVVLKNLRPCPPDPDGAAS